MYALLPHLSFFFFNDTATTEIYTLSLHDALPIFYEVGDQERTFFFLQDGFVKVGTVTSDGHELIYDVRKGGDVVGELCASEPRRPDRAVALEQTDGAARKIGRAHV